jgi:serine phosphatase RsbU (regulator of sigma subunit)
MAETNNQLIGRNGEGRLGVHAFFARIDLANGRMSYASAGDIRPLLKHSYDEWKDCSEKNGMGLGIMKNVPFAVRQQSLVQGDLLCLYTPSVAGIENRKGEPLDNAGIMEEMERIIQQEFTLEGMYRKMQEKIEKFRAGKEQKPDSALVLFRYFGE